MGADPVLIDELEGNLIVSAGMNQSQSIEWIGTTNGKLTDSDGDVYDYDLIFEGSIGRSADSDALIGNGVFTGVMTAPDGTFVTEGLGGFVTASGGN